MLERPGSALAFFVLGALAAALSLTLKSSAPETAEIRPVWREVKWRFPSDQWGRGKAFRCAPTACGTEVEVFLRAKIGFCNCTTGVKDDPELERVADLDLFGDARMAAAPGHAIAVRWMKGRSRGYSFPMANASAQSVLAIAFNDHCDALVATVVAGNNRPAELEPVVLEFLNGDVVLHWAEVALGL